MTPLALVVAASLVPASSVPSERRPDSYPLDGLDRTAAERGRPRCPRVPMVRYRGRVVRYHSPVWIYEGFADRLARFEAVVRDVSLEVYGRAPQRIRHLGTYNCRRINGYAWLSEHAFGNGIDVAGFDFGPLPRRAEAPAGLPRRLRRSFRVTVIDHWQARGRVTSVHARFLDTLARRLVARPDIFRVLLGPSYPGHDNHFHFDCGPFRMVEIWDGPEEMVPGEGFEPP